ncbi:GIN domain-containing protein [Photobacterium leiognathi]|uniref:GIN domain-containing protein n=1 Tax=Photobacterium leiognathi TaxID=553611 RepID=UPI002739B26F|nr:DUF2807 domain-containing protein [Photobacterium leiognathi]
MGQLISTTLMQITLIHHLPIVVPLIFQKRKVNLQTIKLENSGTYKSGVQASHADIHISGSGSVYADVKDQASVNISGSGDLYLTGSPALKSVSITGSGQIHSM